MLRNHNPPYSYLSPLVWLRRCLQRFRPSHFISSERRNRGQGFVEFALILPVLLLIMLGIIEFGYVFTAYSGMFNAAREGARHAVTNPKDVSGIVASTQEKVFLADPSSVDVIVRYDSGPDTAQFTDPSRVQIGDRVLVYLACDLPTITPMIQPIVSSLPIHTQAARTVVSLGDGTWNPSSGPGGADDAGEGAPGMELSVTADPMAVESGGAVQFTYVITNTGDVNLTSVTIVDDFGNTIDVGDLAVGANAAWTIVEIINTTTTNSATATGTDPQGGTVSVQDSVTVSVVGAALDLTVMVEPQTVYPGELVNFTYVVTNTGDADLTNVSVVDGFGVATAPADLVVGQSVFWRVSYSIYETTVNDVNATGNGPLGSTVSDSESATVLVLEGQVPIVVSEPLQEGDFMVAGTAHPGSVIHIRDLMNTDFPAPASDSTTVLLDGTFEFTDLPPLVAGHVILVEGYGRWDSAVVYGDLDPIVINALCHGSGVVDGTAHPGEFVGLHIVDTGYQDSTTVDASGMFTFTLPVDQPLQAGQTVEIAGYGETASTVVGPCTTDAYIVIAPQCGPTGSNVITLNGYNWEYQNSVDYINVNWDSGRVGIVEAGTQSPQWETQIIVDATAGVHQVSAVNKATPEVVASFVSPCPAPNLVLTDLRLLTSGPIATYQPLAFSVAVENAGSRPVNSMFWVDLYSSQPTTIATGIAWAAASGLGVGDTVTLTVPLQAGFEMTVTYPIWALADSRYQVAESDEGDNDYGPVSVDVLTEGDPPLPPLGGKNRVVGETWVSMTGIPVPHGRTYVRCFDGDGRLVFATTSNDVAKYEIPNLLADTYTLIAETWIDGVRYSRTLDGVIVNEGEIGESTTTMALIIMYRD
jgi:hypothetical protein